MPALPGDPHRPTLQGEGRQVQDGLVAQVHGQKPRLLVHAGRGLAAAHHRRDPALPGGLGQEGGGHRWPLLGRADGVTGGQRDRAHRAVGDDRVAGAHAAAVVPQREVGQRVVRAGQQRGQPGVGAAAGQRRAQQSQDDQPGTGHERHHDRQREEHPEPPAKLQRARQAHRQAGDLPHHGPTGEGAVHVAVVDPQAEQADPQGRHDHHHCRAQHGCGTSRNGQGHGVTVGPVGRAVVLVTADRRGWVGTGRDP